MRLNRRLVIASLVFATLVASSIALAAVMRPEAGGTGAFPIAIVAPDGSTLFEGVVTVENATALSVLQAAARAGGFALELEDFGGMGTYVRAIGPHRAEGASGWVYEIRGPDDTWTSGDRSAAFKPISQGGEVRWSWTESGA